MLKARELFEDLGHATLMVGRDITGVGAFA
jgi:hypothetical protein